MNHLGNANKMVGETLRTDARLKHKIALRLWPDFARTLERELNAATSEVERLRKANLQLSEGAEEQKQRIKRLEEAGDRMDLYASPHDSDKWNKAKDDKP